MPTSIEQNKLFGIYVHWPFCKAKCPYCDFNSHVRHKAINQKRYVAAFLRELEYFAAQSPNRMVTSIFFGGGTPSLMEGETIAAIIKGIAANWQLADDVEISMEANPTSVEADRFVAYRKAGVNRVSLGVQALDDEVLRSLGRQHSVSEAIAAIELARENFPRISFDLIYGRAGQTLDGWESELNRAIDLTADHLSLYQLTIEEGTRFYDLTQMGKILTVDDDTGADLYELTREITKARGLPAYEISNHAREGAECLHNLTYWRYQDYVGIGAGAHGRITTNQGKYASICERHPETWLDLVENQGHGVITRDLLSDGDYLDEMLLMGLRLKEGFDVRRYEALKGDGFDQAVLDELQADGYIIWLGNGRLRVSDKGWPVLNSIIAKLAI
jgi:oxygen-independent coproporphyrinogen-3 oxidase